ncbi:MAG: glycine--tRNA ligase subunit beta [Deltaproteobacteria bacterium]|nr:glycine--tRNA ligase subunit beta [Deltaproteobacteria bacterium]
MKGEFLLEIGIEEIPAGYIKPALRSVSELFSRFFENSLISHGPIETFATPRRLIMRISDVAESSDSRTFEKTGPPVASAFDDLGKPTKAAEGFARSQGVSVGDLIRIQTPKCEVVGVRKTEEGSSTIEALSQAIPEILEKIYFPKTMRWMDLDVRFVRPIHWIIAIFDGTVIPFSFGNISSANYSFGHRFTHPQSFMVASFHDFRDKLSDQGIEIDFEKRAAIIKNEVKQMAESEGLMPFEDEALLDEISFLVESPYPIMGSFSKDFLELPASILITCMKKHQRYFCLQDAQGRIRNRFIAVNNTPVKDEEVSRRGHQRVLKARLEDARFYFKEDRKQPLFNRLGALKGVVFHSRLGTAFEKVERFAAIARMLAGMWAPEKISQVERAALLCKCDLETGIVYEFPELQGIIGSYYARMDGESDEVATAIREHYLPTHSGDDLPESVIGAVLSISDRIDTICGCFSVGLIPSGAADPYALRRHAISIIQILMRHEWKVDLTWLIKEAVGLVESKRSRSRDEVEADVLDFFRARFVNFHAGRDFPLDVVEAVVRADFYDMVDARRRLEALAAWKKRDDFELILVGFKRVMNILKDQAPAQLRPELLQAPSEIDLYETLKTVSDRCGVAFTNGDYSAALEIMTELRRPIDVFFDSVLVMAEDPDIRRNRLALLGNIFQLFTVVADFSFIGSTA